MLVLKLEFSYGASLVMILGGIVIYAKSCQCVPIPLSAIIPKVGIGKNWQVLAILKDKTLRTINVLNLSFMSIENRLVLGFLYT